MKIDVLPVKLVSGRTSKLFHQDFNFFPEGLFEVSWKWSTPEPGFFFPFRQRTRLPPGELGLELSVEPGGWNPGVGLGDKETIFENGLEPLQLSIDLEEDRSESLGISSDGLRGCKDFILSREKGKETFNKGFNSVLVFEGWIPVCLQVAKASENVICETLSKSARSNVVVKLQ